jgi:hypothetical protein
MLKLASVHMGLGSRSELGRPHQRRSTAGSTCVLVPSLADESMRRGKAGRLPQVMASRGVESVTTRRLFTHARAALTHRTATACKAVAAFQAEEFSFLPPAWVHWCWQSCWEDMAYEDHLNDGTHPTFARYALCCNNKAHYVYFSYWHVQNSSRLRGCVRVDVHACHTFMHWDVHHCWLFPAPDLVQNCL